MTKWQVTLHGPPCWQPAPRLDHGSRACWCANFHACRASPQGHRRLLCLHFSALGCQFRQQGQISQFGAPDDAAGQPGRPAVLRRLSPPDGRVAGCRFGKLLSTAATSSRRAAWLGPAHRNRRQRFQLTSAASAAAGGAAAGCDREGSGLSSRRWGDFLMIGAVSRP